MPMNIVMEQIVKHPSAEEWLIFSPHNLDSEYFVIDENTDTSHGGGWDGRLYIHIIMLVYG